MAVYTGQTNMDSGNIRSTKDTKIWILGKLEYLEMSFFL